MGITKPRQGHVQFADPAAPAGIEVSGPEFMRECRQSALARFRRRDPGRLGCRTIEHVVPPKDRAPESTGVIVAHLSPALCWAWETSLVGSVRERRAHVEEQMHLALSDLAEQDMHGYLAITDEQCDLYGPDLVQLTTESLQRTTFSKLGLSADPHWEGTLVERVYPPYLILALSIGLEDPLPDAAAHNKKKKAAGRRRAKA